MKLLGSTENKTTKDKNDENVTQFEITEVALYCQYWLSTTFKCLAYICST